MKIEDQDHYRELFDKLFGKFLTDKTSIEDVKFSLMDATFKACYEMLIREAITPYDAMVIMTKQNIEMQKRLTELIMMHPQPIRFKDE
jgi:hypothetical protein